jgi:hypothetical protein
LCEERFESPSPPDGDGKRRIGRRGESKAIYPQMDAFASAVEMALA